MPEREFLIRVSYMEIYNEVIKDLLNPENNNLRIHETYDKGIFVGNITEELVLGASDIERIMYNGDKNRHVGVTNMNERSSRSHTIFRMMIESRELGSSEDSGSVRVSQLNLVDLAGSERVGHTGAEGIRLKEGGHINKSLLILGTVIKKLSENSAHVPYRDSKLTRILQPSLGGNACTAIICTVTPASAYIEESLSTLKFASRAKTIKNTPEMNEVISDEAMLKQYRKEISRLKKELEDLQEKKTDGGEDSLLENMELERKQVEAISEQHKKDIAESEKMKDELEHKIKNLQHFLENGIHEAASTSSINSKKQKVSRRKTFIPSLLSKFQDFADDKSISFQSEKSCGDYGGINSRKRNSLDGPFDEGSQISDLSRTIPSLDFMRAQSEKLRSEFESKMSSRLQEIGSSIELVLNGVACDNVPSPVSKSFDQITQLRNDLDAKILDLKSQEENLRLANIEAVEFREECKMLLAKVSELESSIAEKTEAIEKLRQSNEEKIEEITSQKNTEQEQALSDIKSQLEDARKALQGSQETAEKLSELEGINHQFVALQEEHSNKEEQLLQAKIDYEEAMIKCANLASSNEEMKKQILQLKFQYENVNIERAEFEKAIEDKANEISDLKMEKEQAVKFENELQSQLEKNSELQVALKESNELSSNLKAENTLLSCKVEELLQELEHLKSERENAPKNVINELEHKNALLEEELASERSTKSNLKSELDASSGKLESMEKEISDFVAKNDLLKDENSHQKERINSLETDVEKIQTELSSKLELNSKILEDFEKVKKDNESLENKLKDAEERIAAELLNSQKMKSSYDDQVGVLQKQNQELSEKIESLNTEMESLSKQIAQEPVLTDSKPGADLEKLKKEKQLLKEELDNLREENSSLIQSADDLKKLFDEYQKSNDEMAREIRKLRSRADVADQMETKLETIQESHDSVIKQLEVKTEEIQNLNKRFDELNQEKSSLVSEKSKIESENQKTVEELHNLEGKLTEMRNLETEIRDSKAKKDQEVSELKASLNDFKQTYEENMETIRSLRSKCSDLEFVSLEKQNLEISLADEVKKSDEFAHALTSLRKKFEELEAEYSAVKTQRDELQQRMDEESGDISQLHEEFENTKVKSEKLESELNDLKVEFSEQIRMKNEEFVQLQERSQNEINQLKVLMQQEADTHLKTLETHQESVKKLEAELALRNEKARAVAENLDGSSDASVTELRQAFMEQQQSFLSEESRWNEERGKLLAQVEELMASLEKIKAYQGNEKQKLSNFVNEKERKIIALTQEIQKYEQTIDNLKASLRDKDREYDNLNRKFQAMEERYLSPPTDQLSQYGDEFSSLRMELDQLKNKNVSLSRELRDMARVKQESLTKIAKLQAELQFEKSKKETTSNMVHDGGDVSLSQLKSAAYPKQSGASANIKSPTITKYERIRNKENENLLGNPTSRPRRPLGRRQEKKDPDCNQQ